MDQNNIQFLPDKNKNDSQPFYQVSDAEKKFGKNVQPKEYIAYIVLIGAFVVGILLTIIVAINHWLTMNNCDWNQDISKPLILVWQLPVPIITLVIGYLFGKENKR